MKISETHHKTKDGIIKKNPAKTAGRFIIYRYYRHGGKKFVKTVSTKELAVLHCSSPGTQKPGVYFEGWVEK